MRNPKIYSELNKRMVYSKQGDGFASVVTGHNSRNVTVIEENWFNDAPAQRVSHRFSSQLTGVNSKEPLTIQQSSRH